MIGVPEVLRVRDFRNVWLASLASNAGSWLQVVAAGWLILDLTGSPAAVGALALMVRGPALALSAYAGGLADRLDRRWLGVATFLAQGLAAAVLAALAIADAATPLAIYLLSLALGIAFALGLPAMLALVPALVAPGRLSQAVSLNAAGINVARLVGPAVGGAVLAAFGPGVCFAVNAGSFLALVIALLALLALPGSPRQPPRPERAGLRPALAFAVRDPAARRLLMGAALFCALASPAQELAPVVAENLGGGPSALGLLLGAMGGGALLGAWGLERLTASGYPRSRALPAATLAFGAGVACLAAAPWLPLAILVMAYGGFFWIWIFAGTNTSLQLRSPPALLGRMLGLYQLSVIGPIALGSLAAGALAELVGIRWSLGACAAGLVAWGLWSLTHAVPAIDATMRDEDRAPSGGVREGLPAPASRAAGAPPR